MAEIKIRTIAKYNGHSIKTNKSVDLGIICGYDELTNYIQLVQFLNENTDIIVKLPDQKAKNIGTFMLKEIKIDHDGQGVIKFNSLMDNVNADLMNELVGEQFKIMFKADVEVEDEEDE